MTTLVINVEYESQNPRSFCEPIGQIVRPPRIHVTVRFQLIDEFGRDGACYVWNMEAYQSDDEGEMRAELLKSTWWEFEISSDSETDPRDIGAVHVNDPKEILKWLCPGQDLKDLFTLQIPKKRLNDKPVRLPEPSAE